ncbi:hypothetical protein LCGC14_0932280 [marine sediment metagenome]|uniref:Uncharacterized protein n=1 Tax=marine sediment metagenome TaxID=412755 RepID=A0A0F9P8N4_9ZZZZ
MPYVKTSPGGVFESKAHPDNKGLNGHDDCWRIDPVRFRIIRQGTVIVVEPWATDLGAARLCVWTQEPESGDRQHQTEFEINDHAMEGLVVGFATGRVSGDYAATAMNVVFRQRILCSDAGLRWLLKAMPESFVRECIKSLWKGWKQDSTMLEDDAFILSAVVATVAADEMDVAMEILKTELSEDV